MAASLVACSIDAEDADPVACMTDAEDAKS